MDFHPKIMVKKTSNISMVMRLTKLFQLDIGETSCYIITKIYLNKTTYFMDYQFTKSYDIQLVYFTAVDFKIKFKLLKFIKNYKW